MDATLAELDGAPPPNAIAVRVDEPPRLDGRLDDRAWTLALPQTKFMQAYPNSGAEPSEPTQFRVVFDDDHLYFGIRCEESDPSQVIARDMSRDGSLFSDDYCAIVFDTFLDRRNGYYFGFNANGARYDALITGNRSFDESWDGIWEVRGRRDDRGWAAEVKIPFKTLAFDPASDTWGFNVSRNLKTRFERVRWSGPEAQFRVYNVSVAGTLSGLEGIRQGRGIQVSPYALGKFRRDHDPIDDDWDFEAGGDVRYRIAPNLTASLSYNTDFAETEVDARQVNLTRFPLFFPEKRAFFLEDSGIFRFGGLGSNSFLPFFSRRIGLSADGEIVPLVVAGKLTGRVGEYNIGAIDTLVDDHDGLDERNAFVGRISRNVLDQSTVGALITAGDPNSRDDNFLGGVDFNYRTTEFLGDHTLELSMFGLGSYTENVDSDENLAFGAELELPNDLYDIELEAYQIDENFRAGLGFVPRKSIRSYSGQAAWRARPESLPDVRRIFSSYTTTNITDLDDRLETSTHVVTPAWIIFETGDEIYASFRRELDAPDESFEISDGVTITPGDYWWTDYEIGFETASKRLLEFTGAYRFGEFYDGRRERYSLMIDLRATKYLNMAFGYELNQVRLPAGDFDTRLGSVRLRIHFTPEITWSNLVQYDNVSDTIGLNSRVRWEIRPGTSLFVVANQNSDRSAGRLETISTELTVKLGATFRF